MNLMDDDYTVGLYIKFQKLLGTMSVENAKKEMVKELEKEQNVLRWKLFLCPYKQIGG